MRLAIAAAVAAVELGWWAGQLPAWALTLVVLVPWLLAAWLAGQPRATALAWPGWMLLSVAAVYGVAWSLNPGPHWAETEVVLVCRLLWGALALGWLVTGGPGRWALSALALAALVRASVSWWPVLAAPTWPAGLEVLRVVGMVALIAASFVPTRTRIRNTPCRTA